MPKKEIRDRSENNYLERSEKVLDRITEGKKQEKLNKFKIIEAFIKYIENRPLVLTEFDEKIWMAVVDKVTVLADKKMVFSFKDGTEI